MSNSLSVVSKRISDLSVVELDPRSINKVGKTLSHNGVPIGEQAFTDICNAFALQYSIIGGKQASDEWDHKNPNAWRDLSRALSQFRGKQGLPAVLDSTSGSPAIVRILGRRKPEPGLLDFLRAGIDSTSRFIADSGHFNLTECRVDLDRMELTSVLIDTQSAVSALAGDDYRVGSVFQFGLASTLMRPSLLRLVCSNGLSVMSPVGLRRVSNKTPDSFVNSVRRVDPFGDVQRFLRSGVSRMRRHNASVYECLRVAAETLDHKKSVCVDIAGITDAYRTCGLEGELGSRPQSWQRQANSGVNAYDLFNIATSNASHTPLADEPRNKLNLLASKMLVDGPDLTNLPPDPFTKRGRGVTGYK